MLRIAWDPPHWRDHRGLLFFYLCENFMNEYSPRGPSDMDNSQVARAGLPGNGGGTYARLLMTGYVYKIQFGSHTTTDNHDVS